MKFKNYFQSFTILSILYFIYAFNYIHIRESGVHIRQIAFFDYECNFKNLFVFYVLSVPFVSYVISKIFENIFAMLLSVLMLGGVLPGIVAYSQSSLSSRIAFFIFFVYVPFLFMLYVRPVIKIKLFKIRGCNIRKFNRFDNKTFLFYMGMAGVAIYCYLWFKYHNIIHFKGFFNVYGQRAIFASSITKLEGYLILFAKSISVYSLLALSLLTRKRFYILFIAFIYISDYGLGGQKSSIFMLLFSILYIYLLSKINLKKYYLYFVLFFIFIYSIVINLAIFLNSDFTIYFIAIYERIFYVTSGLFARYYDYTSKFGFFYGSNGMIGKIFHSDINNVIPAAKEIGAYYFKEGVRANANLIADGYLNFGYIGSFMQLFVLWLLFSREDNELYKANLNIIFPFLFFYASILCNIGLQTAMISYFMIIFILILKFKFIGR